MTAVERWLKSAHQEMRLPSGRWAQLKAVNAEDMVLRDLLPKQLRKAVLAGGGDRERTAGQLDRMVDEDAAEALRNLADLRDRLAIARLYAIRDSTKSPWERVPAGLSMDDLPADDADALRKLTDGVMTPAMVTAIVQRNLGEISDAAAAAIVDADRARTVEAWDSFRDDRGGASARPAGGDVAPTPIRVDRPLRSHRRARAG